MPLLHVSRYRELVCTVAARLLEARRGIWDASLGAIVPSAAIASGITTELLAASPNGVAGLQIVTPDTLARMLLDQSGQYPRVASDEQRRLAMRVAARSIDDPMMNSRGIAAMLERAYRDVRDSGLTLDAFATRVRKSPRLREKSRTQLVLRAWQEYERLLHRIGAIDPADLFARATAVIASSPPERSWIVAGFYDMTGVQLQLVEALHRAQRLDSMHIPVDLHDERGDYRFARPFVTRASRMTDGEPRRDASLQAQNTHFTIHEHATRDDELRAVCDEIALLLTAGVSPRTIAVVARSIDPYDARLLARFAVERGFRIETRQSSPLTSHRIARGVATLLRIRDRAFPRHDVLELVRDGLRTRTPVDLDTLDDVTRRARVAGGTSEELRAIGQRGRFREQLRHYLDLLGEIEALTEPASQPRRGNSWGELLQRFTAAFSVETEHDLEAVQELDAIGDLFRSVHAFPVRFDSAAVLDALERAELPIAETADAALPSIFFGDVMKFRGHTVAHLFAVRTQDDVFPQRRTEDPLFPDSDRRNLGLREIGNGREEEQLLFRLLFDSATEEVHISFAGSDGFGKVLRPSQFVKQLAIDADLAQKHEILHDFSAYVDERWPRRELRATAPARLIARPLQLLVRAGDGGAFDGELFATGEHPFLREQLVRVLGRVTPTRLENFGECPQKFLWKDVLRVDDVDDPERELQINPRDKGMLDHEVLERFYRGLSDETLMEAATSLPQLPEPMIARLETLIDESFDRFDDEAPAFNRTVRAIERRATKRILRDFVSVDLADLAATGLRPKQFEYRFGTKWEARGMEAQQTRPFRIEAAGIGIDVEGSIDRIDSDGGRFRIVDYKSGKALRHTDLAGKIDRGVRLQLAVYAMAVAEFFGADPSHISATIKPLVVEDLKLGRFTFSLADKREALLETFSIFVQAIQAGAFPAFPNDRDDDFNACKFCPMNQACRTRHEPDERWTMLQWREPRTLLASRLGIELRTAAEAEEHA